MGSVETLHDGAEMPKRKSSRQFPSIRKGQGNLMSDAKQVVASSILARDVYFFIVLRGEIL